MRVQHTVSGHYIAVEKMIDLELPDSRMGKGLDEIRRRIAGR